MAGLGYTFDANTVDPSAPFAVYPPGKYVVEIVKSEMQATKDGSGSFLSLEMNILDGKLTGQKLFDRLNLVNNNQQAVDIAQRTLSAICHATGQLAIDDSEQLHCLPMLADVRVKPAHVDKGGTPRDASNEIKGYSAVTQTAPAPQTATRPAAPAQAAAPVPAWKRAKA